MTNIPGSSAQLPKLPISYDKVEVRESGSNKLINRRLSIPLPGVKNSKNFAKEAFSHFKNEFSSSVSLKDRIAASNPKTPITSQGKVSDYKKVLGQIATNAKGMIQSLKEANSGLFNRSANQLREGIELLTIDYSIELCDDFSTDVFLAEIFDTALKEANLSADQLKKMIPMGNPDKIKQYNSLDLGFVASRVLNSLESKGLSEESRIEWKTFIQCCMSPFQKAEGLVEKLGAGAQNVVHKHRYDLGELTSPPQSKTEKHPIHQKEQYVRVFKKASDVFEAGTKKIIEGTVKVVKMGFQFFYDMLFCDVKYDWTNDTVSSGEKNPLPACRFIERNVAFTRLDEALG
jgi:hypothetical protein